MHSKNKTETEWKVEMNFNRTLFKQTFHSPALLSFILIILHKWNYTSWDSFLSKHAKQEWIKEKKIIHEYKEQTKWVLNYITNYFFLLFFSSFLQHIPICHIPIFTSSHTGSAVDTHAVDLAACGDVKETENEDTYTQGINVNV